MSRRVLVALGILVGLYGARLLLGRQGPGQLVDVVTWLAAGVVIHDFVLAPVLLALVALGARLLPGPVRAPAVVGLVVLGASTLLAVPVLGRFGARRDNPTLLDRDYAAGWMVLAALVLVGVTVASLVRWRTARGERSARGLRPGR